MEQLDNKQKGNINLPRVLKKIIESNSVCSVERIDYK